MQRHSDKSRNVKQQMPAVLQKQAGGTKSTRTLQDNRPKSSGQKEMYQVAESDNPIQMVKFGKEKRFGETFKTKTGLQGHVIGKAEKPSKKKAISSHKVEAEELPRQEIPVPHPVLGDLEEELPRPHVPVAYPGLDDSEEELPRLHAPVPHPYLMRSVAVPEDADAKIERIARTIVPSSGMDCDRWAADFQQALEQENIPFKPVKLLIRPKKKKSAIAIGAEIRFKGEVIGHDSHYYTIVHMKGEEVAFDNLSPHGIPKDEHFAGLAFYLENPENKDRYNPDPVEVSYADNVIKSDTPAKNDRM